MRQDRKVKIIASQGLMGGRPRVNYSWQKYQRGSSRKKEGGGIFWKGIEGRLEQNGRKDRRK